jgi:quercetin dioxygenase-like cupin family protein
MVLQAMKGKRVGPDEGKLYKRANEIFVKVTAEDTGGVYEVCEERCPSRFSSRKHRHTRNHETFYVLEGSATFILGDDTFEGTQGSLFHIPAGVPHQIIAGDDGIRMLLVYSPGKIEAMFKDMTALTPEQQADFETGKKVAAKHDTIWVEE